MKKIIFLFIALSGLFASCGKEGPEGPAGKDGLDGVDGLNGNANVYYSDWVSPEKWYGKVGDWYFGVLNDAIAEDIIESGAILAYMRYPGDAEKLAVRPLPATISGATYNFMITGARSIEYSCDGTDMPGITDYHFRFIVIPSNVMAKKSGSINNINIEELKTLPYAEVCKKLNISE